MNRNVDADIITEVVKTINTDRKKSYRSQLIMNVKGLLIYMMLGTFQP